jgi:hypothetical protein
MLNISWWSNCFPDQTLCMIFSGSEEWYQSKGSVLLHWYFKNKCLKEYVLFKIDYDLMKENTNSQFAIDV